MTAGSGDVGLVGLGLMGSGMARRLLGAGHLVRGYDVDPGARAAHADRGGVACDSPAEVAAGSRIVLLSLPNGSIGREVCLGPAGIASGARPGTVVADTSTARPDEVDEVAHGLSRAGVRFLDAALSGSSNMIATGDMLAVVGGADADFAAVQDVLAAFCREVRHVGGLGAGRRAKLVINLVLGVNRFAMAEGLVLAEKMGMPPGDVLDILRASAAHSRAMDMWGPRMVERDYGHPNSHVRTHNKDAHMILELGRAYHVPLLLMTQFNQVVQAALTEGLAEADNAAVVEALRSMAGIGTAR
jgi:3-hydroxyisobutyrate dehydrogenase-like beta-hydroxyacid dehydrogenase